MAFALQPSFYPHKRHNATSLLIFCLVSVLLPRANLRIGYPVFSFAYLWCLAYKVIRKNEDWRGE